MERADNIWNLVLFLGGPIIWAGQFLTAYGVAGLMCARPDLTGGAIGTAVVNTAITATAIVLLIAFMLWRYAHRGEDADDKIDSGIEWGRVASIWLALLSLLAVIWGAFPLFLLTSCPQ